MAEYLAAMEEAAAAARNAAEAALEAAAAVRTLQTVIDDLHGKTIDIGIDTAGAAAADAVAAAMAKIAAVAPAAASGMRDAAGASAGLAGAEAILAHELPDISADLIQQTALLRTMAASMTAIQRDIADTSADLMMQTQILGDLRNAWLQMAVAAALGGGAAGGAGGKIAAAGAAAGGAATALGFFARWWPLIHWGLTITYEALAVIIPALVALGAGLLVASQGAQNVYQHFQALNTAVSATGGAFGQSVSQVLGLGNALQNAQTAANPKVYEILGSVINDLKGKLGGFAAEGLQVIGVFDQFAARVTVDLQGALGGQLHALLAGGVQDLIMFGQILGNVGHALLNFASAAPGLAQVLLQIADAISRVILWLSQMPQWLLTALIVWHEFYMWGGLVASMLMRLATILPMIGPLIGTSIVNTFAVAGRIIQGFASVGASVISIIARMASGLANIIPGASGAAAALGKMVTALDGVAAMSPAVLGAWGLAIAALGALTYWLLTAKTATEKWIAASDQAVRVASDLQVLNVISSQYAQTSVKLAAAQAQVASQVQATSGAIGGGRFAAEHLVNANMQAAFSYSDLSAHMQSLIATASTVISNADNLGQAFHVSGAAALYLANAAGVNLQSAMAKGSQAFAIAVQQIRNYITGIGAMGAPMGVLGNDVMALGIQSQLASSKVQQLNSAWDAWIQSVTGGVAAMAQVETALAGMSNAVTGTSSLLSGAITSVSRAAQQSSYTLKGFGQNAMQSWQQFTSVINTGNTALDSLRIGMAENVVSFGQFKSTVQGLVGQMAPFTQGNAAAVSMLSQLAQEAGGPATTNLRTLEHWAGVTGNTARNQFAKGMLAASIAMGNMSKVAQNLSAVVSGQLDQSMASAIVQNSGLNQVMQKYATDLAKAGTPAATLATDLHNITQAMSKANTMTGQAAQGLNKSSQAAARAALEHAKLAAAAREAAKDTQGVATATRNASGDMHGLAAAAAATAASLDKHHISAKIAAISTFDLQSKVQGLSGTESGTQGTRDTVNQQLQKMQTQSQLTATAVFNLQGKVTTMAGAALTAAAKMLTLGTAMATAGNQAQTAAGKVYALASAIAGLQSKTITITTNMVTTATHRAAGGPVAPGIPYVVGELGSELFVPSAPGYILPASETRQFLSASSAGGGGYGGSGPNVIHLEATIPVVATVDGKVLFNATKTQTLQYNVRNGGPQSGKLAPGRG